MKLLNSYNKLMSTMFIHTDMESGLMVMRLPGGSDDLPLNVSLSRNGNAVTLPLVMPVEQIVNSEEDGSAIKFHPMSESVFNGQSEVQNKLLYLAGTRMCSYVQGLVRALVELSVNTDVHGDLAPDALALIQNIPIIKKATGVEKLLKYLTLLERSHSGIKQPNPILRIGLDRGVDIEGIRYSRVCRISLPVLQSHDDRIFGKKAPTSTIFQAVYAAYEAVLVGMPLMTGSNSQSAPYFLAFAEGYGKAMTHLHKIAKTLGRHKQADYKLDLSWTKDVPHYEDWMMEELRVQFEGNVGVPAARAAEAGAAETQLISAPQPIVVEGINHVQEEIETHAPVAVTQGNQPMSSLSLKAILAGQPVVDNTQAMAQAATAAPAVVGGEAKKSLPAASQSQQSSDTVYNGDLRINRAPAPTPAPAARPAPAADSIHMVEANGQPIYRADGSPFIIPRSKMPKTGVQVRRDNMNRPMFHPDGAPILDEVVARPAAPQPGYGAPAAQPQLPPGCTVNHMGQIVNQYGQVIGQMPQQPQPPVMPVQGYGTPGLYPQPSNDPIKMATYQQQMQQRAAPAPGYGMPVAQPQLPPGCTVNHLGQVVNQYGQVVGQMQPAQQPAPAYAPVAQVGAPMGVYQNGMQPQLPYGTTVSVDPNKSFYS